MLKRSPPFIIPILMRLLGFLGSGILSIELIISLATIMVLLPLPLSHGLS